jgi:hypothetical protein
LVIDVDIHGEIYTMIVVSGSDEIYSNHRSLCLFLFPPIGKLLSLRTANIPKSLNAYWSS